MNKTKDTKQDHINLCLKRSAKHEVMSLNSQSSEAFFHALAKPINFNKKLAAAFEEHDLRVTSK